MHLGLLSMEMAPIGIFGTPERIRDSYPLSSHIEKGDGMMAMANGDTYQSKALVLEVIQALSKQYGWTEFPRD